MFNRGMAFSYVIDSTNRLVTGTWSGHGALG
jgi:hypothetical protein